MSNSIPFDNFEDIHQDIPRAFSFYRQKLITFAFIPKRLEIPERPKLSDFPRNILFANTVQLGQYSDVHLALYEPDITTFESKDGQKQMTYRNTYGGNSQVKVIKEAKGYYTGVRTINGVDKDISNGETWKNFFLYLTLHGVYRDEAYFKITGGEILEAYPAKLKPNSKKEGGV